MYMSGATGQDKTGGTAPALNLAAMRLRFRDAAYALPDHRRIEAWDVFNQMALEIGRLRETLAAIQREAAKEIQSPEAQFDEALCDYVMRKAGLLLDQPIMDPRD
jgi:hypothetical protein